MQSSRLAAKLQHPITMGSFGTAVTSLLETYTKCLSLLKSHRDDAGNGGGDASSDSLQSTLSSSLRSDRTRVHRAYSSYVLQNGASFEKGDAASQSALNQIVKRLTAALNKVIRSFGGREPPAIDYNSLLALSHGTSLDAVRTIEALSHRVSSRASSSSSRRSVASHDKKQSRRHPRSNGKSKKKPKASNGTKPKWERSRSKSASSTSRSSKRSSAGHRQKSSQKHPSKKASESGNRVSLVTIASDSTKLGEIRRRASRQGLGVTNATYPLYMYPPKEGKKRNKWWKLFGSD